MQIKLCDPCLSALSVRYYKKSAIEIHLTLPLHGTLETVLLSLLLPPPTRQKLCDRSFCVSFCVQDYWKSNEPISLKLGVTTGPTNRKNWLSFWFSPVADMDSGSIFHFTHSCRIQYFTRLISISHTVTPDIYKTWQNDRCWQGNESTTFWERSGRHPDQPAIGI